MSSEVREKYMYRSQRGLGSKNHIWLSSTVKPCVAGNSNGWGAYDNIKQSDDKQDSGVSSSSSWGSLTCVQVPDGGWGPKIEQYKPSIVVPLPSAPTPVPMACRVEGKLAWSSKQITTMDPVAPSMPTSIPPIAASTGPLLNMDEWPAL